jgi:hypothetical protein
MGKSTFSGPVQSTAGFICGAGSTTTAAILRASVSVDLPSIAAGAETDVTVTVPGVLLGDSIAVNTAGLTTGLGITDERASAANTVILRVRNFSAGAIDQAAQNFAFLIIR